MIELPRLTLLRRDPPDRHVFALNSSWNHGIDQGSHIPVVSAVRLVVTTSRECIASLNIRAPFRVLGLYYFKVTPKFASGFPMDWDGRRSRL